MTTESGETTEGLRQALESARRYKAGGAEPLTDERSADFLEWWHDRGRKICITSDCAEYIFEAGRATKALPAGVERDAKIRLNEDGSLDEVVGGTGIHLEQMDTNHWWMAVYHPTGRVTVNFHARGKITAHAERERDATPQPNAEPPND